MASMMTSAYLPAISADFANDMSKPDWLTSELSTGTTIAAIEFDGGVGLHSQQSYRQADEGDRLHLLLQIWVCG
ncbi:hypothetical protein MAR_004000 [Mya arenaria]|uniref:Uncharacterized protein n=1 Tax=Mya arenaria TaxID=6604 RepID=A0ABY7EVB6_MYAAR|nr:hypothetical protein MAR_004000 [Mya arenaria]